MQSRVCVCVCGGGVGVYTKFNIVSFSCRATGGGRTMKNNTHSCSSSVSAAKSIAKISIVLTIVSFAHNR